MLLIDTATTCLQNNCLSIDFFLNINSSFPLIFLSVKWWDGFQSRRIWKRCALFLLPPLLSFADMLVNCNSYVNMQICKKKNWKLQKKQERSIVQKFMALTLFSFMTTTKNAANTDNKNSRQVLHVRLNL